MDLLHIYRDIDVKKKKSITQTCGREDMRWMDRWIDGGQSRQHLVWRNGLQSQVQPCYWRKSEREVEAE